MSKSEDSPDEHSTSSEKETKDDVFLMAAREKKKRLKSNGTELGDERGQWLKNLRWTISCDNNEKAANFADCSLIVKADCNGVAASIQNKVQDGAETSSERVYVVHRIVLGMQSDYFRTIFATSFVEAQTRTTTIVLPSPVVTHLHFENLLDFLYGRGLILNDFNAVSMVYLGDYFQVKKVKEESQAFIGLSMDDDPSSWFQDDSGHHKSQELTRIYQDAKSLHMSDLQQSVLQTCARHPEVMANNIELSNVPVVEFWKLVWDARKNYPDQTVASLKKWSESAAHFIGTHQDSIDRDLFCKLIVADSLPVISPDAAATLMEQEQFFLSAEDRNDEELTCLQERCTNALYNSRTGAWQLAQKDPIILMNLYKQLSKLPLIVMKTIILKTMNMEPKGVFVRVIGAGTESCNGVYKLLFHSNSKLVFVQDGVFNEEKGQFEIYPSKGRFLITFKSFYLYSQNVIRSQESCMPPKTGWLACGHAKNPPPKLNYI
ncbi:unnamed protein product [Pseudo-nitzschia multistriata]|uniref:BTB domain-containing protein n=1 Tax=Pseudo-nitzschia multistriata TaxID=183589 RepID=A0A448ZF42_9STRA|nr:unnamed protein product [Pseudo-nitzschia multistriata]